MSIHRWWQRGVIYQIYPRSFQDSNGDGVGDLNGITERLEYLAWLGVDAIWLSPFFPSPMKDFGYDVADYCGVDPIFGTLEDFHRLAAEAHRRAIRVVLDYVPNHSSDRHPWFLESRASRSNPKRDWYIWRDPAPDGGPPNNWLSEFGGPAWTFDDATGQYYLHSYLTSQPDLNWRNPAVVAAMHEVLRFWLGLGVDGFRIDTVHHLIKDDRFRDNPANPGFRIGMPPHHVLRRDYSVDRPEVHDAIAGMRRVLEEFGPDRVLIAEVYLPIDRMMPYYGRALSGAHLPFNFHLIGTAWEPAAIARIIRDYEAALPAGAWPNWVLGNHDKPRLATRIGQAQARVAAVLLLTLRGTPTIYYGEEIAMENVPIPPDRIRDPFERNVPGLGLGRDPNRTPMQWDASVGAGFTTAEPWLPVAADWARRNVAAERDDPNSLLMLYRRLLALRRAKPALAAGEISDVACDGPVLSYVRTHEHQRIFVALNFSAEAAACVLPGAVGQVLIATDLAREGVDLAEQVELGANEGMVVRLA